jgi:predicted AAA+ superfamily ATPase
MEFERAIFVDLHQWAARDNRKPLILRGARQVGKTTAVNMFSRKFEQYLYLNLEISEERNLFEAELNFRELLQALFFYKNIPRSEKKTLIFIDEIQNSAEAVRRLREFYELAPQLHVVAAGSLLETLISKHISFPVGRVEFLYLYPLTFQEFLHSMGEESAIEIIKTLPFPRYAHQRLVKLFSLYTLTGGMPEVVKNYVEKQDIVQLNSIYESLLVSYLDDVEKYARSFSSAQVIRHAIRSSFFEAGKRIRFHGFGQSNYRSREMGEALRTLEKAMLLRLVYPTTSVKPPIVTNYRKSPKLQILDTGLINYFVGLQKELFGTQELSAVYEGKIAEHIAGQELIAQQKSVIQNLSFWIREKRQSSAEIDFAVPFERYVIPIEVKSGKTGRLKSLHLFMNQSPHPYAVRVYSGYLQVDEIQPKGGSRYYLLNLPFYLIGELKACLKWFVENYR